MEYVSKTLTDYSDKIERIMSEKEKVLEESKSTNVKYDSIDPRDLQDKQFYKSSANIPLEVHVELIHHAYDVSNLKVLKFF